MIEKNSPRGQRSTGGSEQEPLQGDVIQPAEEQSAPSADEPTAQDPQEPIIIEGTATEVPLDEKQGRSKRRRKKLKVEQEYIPRPEDPGQPAYIAEDDPWFAEAKKADQKAREEEWRQWAEGHGGMDPGFMVKGLAQSDDAEYDLQDNISRAGQSYVYQLQKADLCDPDKPRPKRESQLTDLQRAYAGMMALSCVQGFSQGLSAQSIARAAGMATAMWALSPNFKQYTKELGVGLADQASEAMTKYEAHRKSVKAKKFDKLEQKADRRAEKGKDLGWRDSRRRSKLEKSLQDRPELTVQSTALTAAGLDQSLYINLQQCRNQVEELGAEGVSEKMEALRQEHASMMATLYGQAEEDGLDLDEVAKATRVVVGQTISDNPQMAAVYSELGHGTFTMSDPRRVRTPDGRTAHIWEGGFENGLHQPVNGGVFSVRGPMSAEEHEAAITDRITADLLGATSPAEAHGSIVGYAAGFHVDNAHDERWGSMDDAVLRRMKISNTMRSTMSMDGFSDNDQQMIYSNAYMNALELVREISPDVEQKWASQYGKSWQQDFADYIKDPEAAWAEHESRRERQEQQAREGGSPHQRGPFTAGPAQERGAGPETGQPGADRDDRSAVVRRNARRYQRARTNQAYNQVDTGGLTGLGSDDFEPPSADYEMGG